MPGMEDNNQEATDFAKIMVQEVMSRLPNPLSEEEKKQQEEVMLKIILGNMAPKDAMGFSDEMIEHMYAYGHRLYNLGSYKKAKDVFTSLAIFNPDDPRYYLGQGACYQRLKDWENAAAAYQTCSLLDTDSPMPLFYMYECLSQLNEPHDAAACLGEVIARCGDLELFAPIKERCLLLLNKEKMPKATKPKEMKKEEATKGGA
ncbi:MAG: SycD/LcrH family type III secretion system chaperone [Parachlamydia sp.]|nr:SycD/LcrH family type III secretion system chaperone [Parachlamydia sp.]